MKPVLVIAVLASGLAPARAAEVPPIKIHIENFHQVNAAVYRGAQPADADYPAMAKYGIKTVLDLRNRGEDQKHEKQLVEAAGMKYISLPLGELSAPTDGDLHKALSILEKAKDDPVFVHCRRGKDRTGTIVACYRIEHDGWTNQKALAEARNYGMSWLETGMRNFILAYRATPAAPAVVQ